VTWTISAPEPDGRQYGIVHLTDVTEHRDVRRQLAQAQRRFRLAFDCAPIGIAVVGVDGRVLQANRALGVMLGYDPAELVQRSFAGLCQPEERAGTLAALGHQISGALEVSETVKRLRHRDGHTIRARCVIAAAHEPDGPASHLLVQLEDLRAKDDTGADRLRALEVRDPVTGLPTEQVLAAQLAMAARLPRSLLLVELMPPTDLAAGSDEPMTAHFGGLLVGCCREGDLLARVSRREFAVVIGDEDATAGPALAARIADLLSRPIEGDLATPTVRVGVDSDPSGTRTLPEMLRRARVAVGRPPVPTPPPGARPPTQPTTPARRLLALEADLRTALRDGGLHLVYQPIVDLTDGSLRSVEALSRWNHPALGPIAPAEFIAIAERSTLIHALTDWALHTACADLANWHAAQPIAAATLRVAVNISALCIAQPDFPDRVLHALADTGVQPGQLTLEITETAAADPAGHFQGNTHRLRTHGVRIALDDFGAGYSSLARLATLPITELKLDRALTAPALDPAVAEALLRATVGLAGDLGITLIAEGVETPAQLDRLRRCGCSHAQGILFSPPAPAEAITEHLTNGTRWNTTSTPPG
jgi:PAS domain S-box-containing protein